MFQDIYLSAHFCFKLTTQADIGQNTADNIRFSIDLTWDITLKVIDYT